MLDAPSDVAQSEETKGLSEVPVCLRCFTPFEPLQHFCRHCGETVGRWTIYIPYLNIPFRVSIFVIMWQRVWFDKRTKAPCRILFLVLIVIMATATLLGLPFVWLFRSSKTKR